MTKFVPTQQLIDEGFIDPLLASSILVTCPDDGKPILRNYELTFAKCMNPWCRNHMMHRADSLLKYLGHHKGIGPKGCLNLLKTFGLKTHFEVMEKVYKETNVLNGGKPRLHLWEIAMFCYIPGFSTELEDILSGYISFSEYFNSPYPLKGLRAYKQPLLDAEKFFEVKMPLARDKIEVMITGSIHGFKKRDHFIDHLNEIAGHLVRVVLKGKNQSVDYLITEDKVGILLGIQRGAYNLKTDAALKGGVRILTPNEFMHEFAEVIRKRKGLV